LFTVLKENEYIKRHRK